MFQKFSLRYLTFFLLAIASLSCKNTKKAEEPVNNNIPLPDSSTTGKATNYLPVGVFLKGELKWVENFSGAIMLKTKTDSKKDSSYISLQQFNQLANTLISPDMDSAYFAEHFTEESIADGGSEGLSFIYSGTNTRDLKKVIVYVQRNESSDRVGRVYFEKEFSRGDTSITQRCTWKLQHYLMIAETRNIGSLPPTTIVRKAIYDPADFTGE